MLSISHLVVLLLIILVLFGAGKIPNVMGDIGKGIKNFRKGLKDDDQKKEITDQKNDKKE